MCIVPLAREMFTNGEGDDGCCDEDDIHGYKDGL